MRMNSGIILAGQQPDVIGTVARGHAAGRQAGLADLFREQGAGIAQGDEGALNALAAFDPNMALGVKGQQQQMAHADQRMAMDRERMDMLRASARERASAAAAGLSAAQRAEAAEQLKGVLMGASTFYKQGNEQGYNEWLQKNGADPAQFPMSEFPAHAAMVLGSMDALAAPEPADEYQRYVQEERAEGREPLDRISYAQAKKGAPTTIYNPDTGAPLASFGGGLAAEPPKMTVDAAKNTGFLIRMNDANEVLNELEAQGTDFFQQNLESVPLGAGNYARTPEFQRYDQARRNFVNAILRRESGAVIADSEFENANKQYFPVPGDSPEVIEQKRRNRVDAIAGVRAGSGEGAAYADRIRGGGASDDEPETFESFAANPSAQAAAAKAGVTLQEMWELKQELRDE